MFTVGNYKELTLYKFGGLCTFVDPRDLPPGASPVCFDVDFQVAQVGTRPGLTDPTTSFTPAIIEYPVEYLKSSQVLGPLKLTLAEDAGTTLYEENLDNPGIFASFYNPILNNARAISETVNQREYICLSDLVQGTDQPRQYDGTNVDRISQVGPGVGPTVTASSPEYPIISITEIYTAVNLNSVSWGSNINLHDAQPPSANLYFLSALSSTTFTKGLAIGDLVYISGSKSYLGQNPNGTYAITSIGFFTDSDGTRQYFGVTANVANGEFDRNMATGTYQRTPALIQLSMPIPLQDAVVGASITIEGASVPQWNTAWKIAETPTEGQLTITAIAWTGSTATLDYTLQSGNAPGWQPSFAYPIGAQIVAPTTYSANVWQVTTPGTSGGSIPAFSNGGGPYTDGTVVWTQQPSTTKVLVTIFNTTGANGAFIVQDQAIVAADQTSFTIGIGSPLTGSPTSESGNAIAGSGTALIIDPGTVTLGTGNPGVDPIYGNATGGNVLVSSTVVAAGQRYAVLMFLTRSGFITPSSPPVSFFTTGQSGQLTFDGLPIGPPDVIARIVAFTLANAGVGGPYFYVPNDVVVPGTSASLGVTQTFNKTVLDDNSSTSLGPLNISDAVLATSINISVVGNNLQQERELGECVKVVQYAGRCFYLGERVKDDQFLNLTFDGGTLSGLPAGWTIDGALIPYTSVITVGVFASVLEINNTSGVPINITGTALSSIAALSQSAYETQGVLSPIIQPNTAYSVRVIAANPAALISGFLVVELYSPSATTHTLTLSAAANASGGNTVYTGTITGGAGNALAGLYFTVTGFSTPGNDIVNALCVASSGTTLTLVNPNGVAETHAGTAISAGWQAVVPFSSMTTSFLEFILPLNNPIWEEIPSDLQLRIYPLNLVNTNNVEVYRIEIFPTEQPVYTTQVAASYADNTQAIDGVTGIVDTSILSSQRQTNHFNFLNKYYITTKSKHFSPIQDDSNEPSEWQVNEISNAVGCLGPLADDVGEEYVIVADENGVYVFDGGNHLKISQEIQDIWDLLYEPAKNTVWVLNDLESQRILVGVPLPTPNQWLPDAQTNDAPLLPNVILMCSYLGLMTGAEIANGAGVAVSSFGGQLMFHEMKRKWTIWQIPAATSAWIERPDGSEEIWFGQNGDPTITSLNPPSIVVSTGGFTLTVFGMNFTTSSVVEINNNQRVTTFINSGELQAAILAGDITSEGPQNITVFNAGAGCSTSNTATLSVTATPTTDNVSGLSNNFLRDSECPDGLEASHYCQTSPTGGSFLVPMGGITITNAFVTISNYAGKSCDITWIISDVPLTTSLPSGFWGGPVVTEVGTQQNAINTTGTFPLGNFTAPAGKYISLRMSLTNGGNPPCTGGTSLTISAFGYDYV